MSEAFFCDKCKSLQKDRPKVKFFLDERSPTVIMFEGTVRWQGLLYERDFCIALTMENDKEEDWCHECTKKALSDAIEALIANGRLSRLEPEAAP